MEFQQQYCYNLATSMPLPSMYDDRPYDSYESSPDARHHQVHNQSSHSSYAAAPAAPFHQTSGYATRYQAQNKLPSSQQFQAQAHYYATQQQQQQPCYFPQNNPVNLHPNIHQVQAQSPKKYEQRPETPTNCKRNTASPLPAGYARSASELNLDTQASKYRQLPCRTFLSVGTCPYRERCVYLHDPRLASMEGRTKTRKKNKEEIITDAFFWPVMSPEAVQCRLDHTGQPHIVQPYNVPTPQDDEFQIHDAALFSLWHHFVDCCMACSSDVAAAVDYAAVGPSCVSIEASSCYSAPNVRKNPYTNQDRLKIFMTLAKGTSPSSAFHSSPSTTHTIPSVSVADQLQEDLSGSGEEKKKEESLSCRETTSPISFNYVTPHAAIAAPRATRIVTSSVGTTTAASPIAADNTVTSTVLNNKAYSFVPKYEAVVHNGAASSPLHFQHAVLKQKTTPSSMEAPTPQSPHSFLLASISADAVKEEQEKDAFMPALNHTRIMAVENKEQELCNKLCSAGTLSPVTVTTLYSPVNKFNRYSNKTPTQASPLSPVLIGVLSTSTISSSSPFSSENSNKMVHFPPPVPDRCRADSLVDTFLPPVSTVIATAATGCKSSQHNGFASSSSSSYAPLPCCEFLLLAARDTKKASSQLYQQEKKTWDDCCCWNNHNHTTENDKKEQEKVPVATTPSDLLLFPDQVGNSGASTTTAASSCSFNALLDEDNYSFSLLNSCNNVNSTYASSSTSWW